MLDALGARVLVMRSLLLRSKCPMLAMLRDSRPVPVYYPETQWDLLRQLSRLLIRHVDGLGRLSGCAPWWTLV